MAKLKNGQISGLIGAIVAVPGKDEQILRSAPRKRSKESWSDKQTKVRSRFSMLVEFWNKFNHTPVQKIWKIADEGKRGINPFISINSPAFGADGELTDPEKLHFSAGKLPLPHRFKAKRSESDPTKIEVTWDHEPEPGAGMSDDVLRMMISKEGKYSGPVNTGVWRRAGSAVVQLPAGLETAEAVWLSFASDKRRMYSGDQYFQISQLVI
jgi:hypothetical protein